MANKGVGSFLVISAAFSMALGLAMGVGLTGCQHSTGNVAPTVAPVTEPTPAALEKGKCFAMGRAAFDRVCYDFKTKAQCLESSTGHNCGWEAQ